MTSRRKLQALIAGIVVMTYVIYAMALKETFELSGRVSEMEVRITEASKAPQEIAQLQQRVAWFEQRIGGQVKGQHEMARLLLEEITAYCESHHLVLKHFPEALSADQHQYEVNTLEVEVQGGFIPILKLIHRLEGMPQYGKITAVDYTTKKILRTKKKVLTAKIYVQHIHTKRDEA